MIEQVGHTRPHPILSASSRLTYTFLSTQIRKTFDHSNCASRSYRLHYIELELHTTHYCIWENKKNCQRRHKNGALHTTVLNTACFILSLNFHLACVRLLEQITIYFKNIQNLIRQDQPSRR